METGQTVWMVEDGEYSDYHVCGIFSTKENADRYIAELRKANEYGDPSAVEVGVDVQADEYYQPTYHTMLRTSDGSLYNSYKANGMCVNGYSQGFADDNYSYGTSTISEEHSMKVAVEARQAHLRKDI